MKARITATALVLLSLAVCLIPVPAHAGFLTLSLSQGPVGTNVSIPSVTGYGLGNYQLYWGETDQLIGQGEVQQGMATIAFIVPEAVRGKHKVTLKIAGEFFNSEFTVTPSISLSIDQGTVDSNLTVTGRGFNANESNIQILYDNSPVETGIAASNKGSWQSTFKVPKSSRGQHTIDTTGTTPSSEVEDKVFTIIPKIDANPSYGWVGTTVGVYGSGFASGETNIRVTYDGVTVKIGIAADASGSWQSSFSVPASSKGSHDIRAYGAITNEADLVAANFSVSPGIKLEPVSGYIGGAIHVGDGLWVSGVGFEANESGIRVTFDGSLNISNIVADARGSWSDRLEIPLCSKGEHTIDASGEITRATDIVDAIVIVSPRIELNPASGAIGSDITVHGDGFAENQVITISYDGVQVSTNAATDNKGSFTTSFKVPESRAGDHTVTVTDATASVFSASVNVESTPPPIPNPIFPEAGGEFGFLNTTPITFNWTDVEDPSGVYYILEISPSANFAGTVIRKEGLTASEYTLTDNEGLTKGNYYWRVKAVDGADNQSEWTNGQLFEVGGLNWWLILIIIAVVAVVIIIIWRLVSVSRKDEWK
ncbi:MAG: IPT/TIG domain-containing protein [Chloroflexota bacterium]|nr:MAG: IPT/TIG domain-containing protein [Chloroflexota bacterium]